MRISQSGKSARISAWLMRRISSSRASTVSAEGRSIHPHTVPFRTMRRWAERGSQWMAGVR